MSYLRTYLTLVQVGVAVILASVIIDGDVFAIAIVGALASFLGLLTCYAWIEEKSPK